MPSKKRKQVYTLFEKIVTASVVLTLVLLTMHALGTIEIPLLNTFHDLTGLETTYPVGGMLIVGAIFIVLGLFLGILIGGNNQYSMIGKDRDNLQSVVTAYSVLWAFVILFYFL